MFDEDDPEENGELFESDPADVLPNGEDFFVVSDLLPPRLKPEKGEDFFLSSDDLLSDPPNPENGDDFLFPPGPMAEEEENGLLDPEDLLVLEDPRPPLPNGPLLGDLLDEPNGELLGDLPEEPPNPLNPLPGDLFEAPIPPLPNGPLFDAPIPPLLNGDLPGPLLDEPNGDLPGPLLDEPNDDEPKVDC